MTSHEEIFTRIVLDNCFALYKSTCQCFLATASCRRLLRRRGVPLPHAAHALIARHPSGDPLGSAASSARVIRVRSAAATGWGGPPLVACILRWWPLTLYWPLPRVAPRRGGPTRVFGIDIPAIVIWEDIINAYVARVLLWHTGQPGLTFDLWKDIKYSEKSGFEKRLIDLWSLIYWERQ